MLTRDEAVKMLQATKLMLMDGANHPISDLYYALDMAIEALEQTKPQTIRCPKCGRSDYIREFGKDFSVTAEEAGFKYKCINCNTYIKGEVCNE